MTEKDVPLEFIGSSRDDLSGFPLVAKKEIGLALRAAQKGEKAGNAKPLKGFGGASVLSDYLELRRRHLSNRVHRAAQGNDLCSTCVSEEVDPGKQDFPKRHQQDQGPIKDGNRIARGERR